MWDVDRNGTLTGYRLSDGRQVYRTSDAAPTTSFPSLAATGTRLIVPAWHPGRLLHGHLRRPGR